MFNPISWALKRPVTVITLAVGLLLLGTLAARRMRVDIFPNLNLPVVYVCQPYGGMDPSQMEGLLTNYYEYHFLYINGIHHVESRNVQGLALMKLYFHPGTDMAQAMAETLGYVTRARAFMPPGTVSPFVTRFDAGSIPVGYLVLASETRTINEIQDLALFKVRPMFSGLPGVSAPPPFGGSQRTIVIQLDPDRLKSYRMAPDEIIRALNAGNTISPSGTVRFGDTMPIVPVNALARTLDDFRQIPIRPGQLPTIHLGDVANVADAADVPVGSAIINGRKAVYLLVTKRADASTLDVVNNVRNALPDMQAVLPPDIKVSLEFDQSPTVTNAVRTVITEAALGAALVGLMVLLFLRDWRGMLIVIINIPLALAGAIFLLWVSGQSFNLMTLGGLALAIGILVDESTVELENIHTQLRHTGSVPVAVRRGNRETAVPRLLALLCMLAVFAPSFLMTGAIRALFVPLSLAVGYSMICSYLLSSTLVPVLAAWLLKPEAGQHSEAAADLQTTTASRKPNRLITLGLLGGYVAVCCAGIWKMAPLAGFEIFPQVDSGRFQVRIKAPAGTRFEVTEKIVVDVVNSVKKIAGDDGVEVSVGYVGNIGSSYPIQAIFQWTGGPEEAFLRVALDRHKSKHSADETKALLRQELAKIHPNVSFSLEPADIVSEVMSFGSPTPVEVVATGTALPDVRAHAAKLREELAKVSSIRDLRYGQTLDYPALRVDIDRRRAGLSGLTAGDVARSLVTATSSSRFILPSYWPDPKSGIGYQVQVEIPYSAITSAEELANLPINAGSDASPIVLRDVATVTPDQVPGEFDRYNMKRTISLTANVEASDLARVSRDVNAAVKAAGQPPAGVTVSVRGQLATLEELNSAGGLALISTFIVIFLLLTAYYQSPALALVALSGIPAVGLGITLALVGTGTTWNLQSYMGAIMAMGVSVANAIIFVSFAESQRLTGLNVDDAAKGALSRRLRPILMTALAMIAGMLPMTLGLAEGGRQQAPLGRAVIGGLIGSLLAVTLVMPKVFVLIRSPAKRNSQSLDPTDPNSPYYDPDVDRLASESGFPMKNAITTGSLLFFQLIFTGSGTLAQEPAKASATLPKVSVVKAKAALIEHKIEQPGQVEPSMSAEIQSRASGWIKSVLVDIGDVVRKGQPLIEIDAPELQAELATSQAKVDEALAQVELAKRQYEEIVETLKANDARLQASTQDLKGKQAIERQFKMEMDRIKKLVDSGAVTRSNLEEAEQKYLAAGAELSESAAMELAARAENDSARAQLARRQAEITVAESRLALSRGQARETQARHGFTTIRAPFDGVVVERNTDPGQLVSSNGPARQPLLLLHHLEKLTVTVGVPESEAPLVDVGDSVEIFTSQNAAKPAYTGKISRTSRAYNPATRTLRAEIDLPASQSPLNDGQYVLVRVIGHRVNEAVSLPLNSLYKVAGSSFCTVVENGKARRVPVTAGVGDGIRVAISAGLKVGDTVVVGPVAATLADGQAVDATELDETKK